MHAPVLMTGSSNIYIVNKIQDFSAPLLQLVFNLWEPASFGRNDPVFLMKVVDYYICHFLYELRDEALLGDLEMTTFFNKRFSNDKSGLKNTAISLLHFKKVVRLLNIFHLKNIFIINIVNLYLIFNYDTTTYLYWHICYWWMLW